jgi:hypothetical protein
VRAYGEGEDWASRTAHLARGLRAIGLVGLGGDKLFTLGRGQPRTVEPAGRRLSALTGGQSSSTASGGGISGDNENPAGAGLSSWAGQESNLRPWD